MVKDKYSISFTEEAVLNQDALPEGLRGWRYYRAEIWTADCVGYPHERGGLWLPPHVDIESVEKLINGREGVMNEQIEKAWDQVLIDEFGSVRNSEMEYSGTISQMRFAFDRGVQAGQQSYPPEILALIEAAKIVNTKKPSLGEIDALLDCIENIKG